MGSSVLFFTNAEHGQANCILAVAYELLGGFDVHIASYPKLERRVAELTEDYNKAHNGQAEICFHPIRGLDMHQVVERNNLVLPHSPGFFGEAIKSYRNAQLSFMGWSGEEHCDGMDHCAEIIKDVNPSTIVTDPVFWQARDACDLLKREHIILNPCSMRDVCLGLQPRAAMLWKYPALSSGYPFPVPWYLIPANAYLAIRLALYLAFGARTKELNEARQQRGVTTLFPILEFYREGRLHLCAGSAELDFPLEVVPEDVVGCGPIVLPSPPVAETDRQLAEWLNKSPTILINLGSYHDADADHALEVAKSLKIVLGRRSNIQILWKLKSFDKLPDVGHILETELLTGKVKIVDWLKPNPISLLETGQVVCSVNHGGANSFYEACKAGIPQIILAAWWDVYDYAARAEYLGFGIYGNRGCAPGVNAEELGRALMRAIEEDKELIAKARQVGEICQKSEGRKVAAGKIAERARRNQ